VTDGHVAEWLRNGLQNRVPQFNSGRGLHRVPLRPQHTSRPRAHCETRAAHLLSGGWNSLGKELLDQLDLDLLGHIERGKSPALLR
jgi:hypothetical protein